MKGKRTSKTRIRSLALAVALLTTSLLTGGRLRAQAAGVGKNDTITVDRTGVAPGSTIMLGKNNIVIWDDSSGNGKPIKWRVMATETDSNGDTILTLLADKSLGDRPYDKAVNNQQWINSDMCNYLNGTDSPVQDIESRAYAAGGGFLQRSFSVGEQSIMVKEYGTANEVGEHQNIDSRQTIVLPSEDEVKDGGTWGFTNDIERRVSPMDFWWLRSLGNYNHRAMNVYRTGNVVTNGNLVYGFTYGIRPAFKINLTSVLFSSSAAGSVGKPTPVGATLSEAKPPTAEVKLTIKDTNTSNLNLVITDTTARTAVQGESISIFYHGAVTGTGKTISCIVEDSSGIKYYAKLAIAANGTANINIPTDMQVGNYTLKLFNEQDNGDNHTDFASDPIDIPLTVNVGVMPTISGGVTATTDSISLIEGYTAQTKTYTIAGAPAPAVTMTNNGGTGTTVNPTGLLTIPAGLAKGNYTIVFAASNGHLPDATMTVALTVLEIPTVVPTVTPTALTLQEGTTASFAVTMGTGTDRAASVSTVSDDTGVATVDQSVLTANGNITVTGISEGSTTVTLGWSGGSTAGTTSEVTVNVTKAPPVPPVPPQPPVTTSTGGRSNSSGGTSKADVAPVAGRAFTKPEAIKLFNIALAAKPEGQTTLSLRARNYTSADKAAFTELTALAQKNGVIITVHFDTVVKNAVTYRLSVNPALVTISLDLTAKILGGKLTLPKFPVPVEVAVKMPEGLTIETLKIAQNGKDITATAKPWLDKNGYLHFTTTGGEIVLGK